MMQQMDIYFNETVHTMKQETYYVSCNIFRETYYVARNIFMKNVSCNMFHKCAPRLKKYSLLSCILTNTQLCVNYFRHSLFQELQK